MSLNKNDIKTQPTTPKTIEILYKNGLLNNAGRLEAFRLLYSNLAWGTWAKTIFTLLGWALILAGIIFFFAYNWENISKFYKFFIIEAALLILVAGAWYFPEKLTGKLFLSGASILVGVFLAVFGQLYQTGADAYTLFLVWTVLIIPWCCVNRFDPLWLIWIFLLNLTLILYWEQAIITSQKYAYIIYALVATLNCILLAIKEFSTLISGAWLKARWYRMLLATAITITSFIPIESFVNAMNFQNLPLFTASIWCLAIQFGILFYYRYIVLDAWPFAMIIMSFCIITLSLFIEILERNIIDKNLLALFITLLVPIVFGAGIWFLRKESLIIEAKSKKT